MIAIEWTPMKRFRVGSWRVEPTLNQLVRADGSDESTKLEPKAMEVLVYLAARAGEVVDKDSVIRDVWQGAFVTNEVLTNAVWELRRALGDDAKSSTFIQTIPKRGYRLVAPVSFEEEPTASPRPLRFLLPAAILGIAGAALVLWPRSERGPQTVIRFSVELAEPLSPFFVPAVALSPDGSTIAYATVGEGIYLRPVDRLESTLVPGTKGSVGPFFSSDGTSLAFYSRGELQTLRLAEDAQPRSAASVGAPRGAAWGTDGFLYFTRGSNDGLNRVRPNGSEPEPLTTLGEGEWTHRWPDVLPGAKAVLFTVARSDMNSFDEADVELLDLETRERRILIEGAGFARYVSGRVVFARGGDLFGVSFDERALSTVGETKTLLKGVKTYPINGAAHFSFSRDGSIAYVPGSGVEPLRRLVAVGRDGTRHPIAEDGRLFYDPALSPDGSKIAISIVTDGNSDLWIYDTRRSTLTRLTTSPGEEEHPLFSPDGRSLAYDYAMAGSFRLYSRAVDGSGRERKIGRGERNERAETFTPDGRNLVYSTENPRGGFDLGLVPLEGEGEERPLLRTPFDERYARISPDGRFLAYSSNESGRFEVYVTTFPDSGPRLQVSAEGGWHPAWTRGGRELVYLTDDAVVAAPISTSQSLSAGRAETLFDWRSPLPSLEGAYRKHYDVSADGERFVLVETEDDPSARRLYVVLGFPEEP
jgi:Tol biopolymer transport system component/DNA-binding winged helix-turn-helix (wHTH) protein